jgi:hypothetical protein
VKFLNQVRTFARHHFCIIFTTKPIYFVSAKPLRINFYIRMKKLQADNEF